jgi:CheY-like chemotaxis protein
MALDMSRFVGRFVEEAREHLTLLQDALLCLEKEPGDEANLYALFRSAHTIKGSAAMLKLKAIAESALPMEDALISLREGKISYSPALGDLLLRATEALVLQVEAAAKGSELAPDAALCRALSLAATGSSTPDAPSAPASRKVPAVELGGSALAIEARILVVDDSISTRELEKLMLETHGYRVSLAEDGLDALEKAVAGRFDLILTDLEMPRLDGFGLTSRLRGLAAYRRTPIVMVTSRDSEKDKMEGAEAGVDAYLVKGSFDQNGLLDTVGKLLG